MSVAIEFGSSDTKAKKITAFTDTGGSNGGLPIRVTKS
jgi:hypothetical protein